MSNSSRLSVGFQEIIKRTGTQIRVQYFTSTIGSVYDDDVTWTQSGGNLWTSGVVLPLSTQRGSSESILVEQGKLINDDRRLFLHGSLILTGSEMTVTIRVGSGVGSSAPMENYSMLDFDIRNDISNTPIYRKVFIRRIGGTGSLLGEA